MYAVMRFGKTFTAMCCAEEMGAKVVVIVSAKKDVKESWHQIVEGHIKFDGYKFFDADDLTRKPTAISEHLNENPDKNKAAVFLTLQDLCGKGSGDNFIKKRHEELFGKIKIDLLIVDETHFGARAEHYGKVLQDPKYIKDTTNGKKLDEDDFTETSEGDGVVKAFDADVVKLHLSGTPYRILMGSEFEKEDIVAFFQYSDIVAKKEKWDNDKRHMDEDEWKNPYYGFPEMVRFAFNPNESARVKLEELRKDGYTYALSALLKPKSIDKDSKNDYQNFENEKEVLDLLKVIDGAEQDDQLFGFLNYKKLRDDAKMCRHIVIVLPYKASCDAMQKLINENKSEFKNLQDYNIINISGVDVNSSKDVKCSTLDSSVTYKSIRGNLVRSVRNFITDCEKAGQKTLTLTVNRMLTGCTVPEWDTMLYMKDTSSPQEYDQAIFRLQNPYTKTYCVKGAKGKPKLDKNGKPIIIKKDMKPQTLLVDFDPMRLFLLQENKAQIYNVNTGKNAGNSKLEDRIAKELEISPLLTIDPDGNIIKVTATNILDKVSQYHNDRGIREEVDEIPIDMGLYKNDDFRNAIAKENEIGSKAGLSIPAHEGDETDPTINATGNNAAENKNSTVAGTQTTQKTLSEEKIWEKKLKSYFVKILLYAYLTDDKVKDLDGIIKSIDNKKNKDNQRIAKHLGLETSILQILLKNINRLGHYEMIHRLDYKIQDINNLSHNTELSVEKQVDVALCKFGKLGDAMVITPADTAKKMVELLPDTVFEEDNLRLLDIAATSGEFAMALYRRMKDLKIDDDTIKKSIYSIPKSSICYELTRKVYKLLDLNIENIAENFNAFDLLKVRDKKNKIDYNKIKELLRQNKKFNKISLDDQPNEKDNNMVVFNAIVSNPPYQTVQATDKAKINSAFASAVYPHFIEISRKLDPEYISIIAPSRWLTKTGQGVSDAWVDDMINCNHFIKMFDFYDALDCFNDVELKGGINYFLYSKNHLGECVYNLHQNGSDSSRKELLNALGAGIVIRDTTATDIINKIKKREGNYFANGSFAKYVSPQHFFDKNGLLTTSWKGYKDKRDKLHCIKYYLNKQMASSEFAWIKNADIPKNQNVIQKHKIYISKAYNGGDAFPHQIIGKAFYGEPGSVCSQTYLVIGYNENFTQAICDNIIKYMKTTFFRYLVFVKKKTQDNPSSVFQFVPLQDFTPNSDIYWSKSVADIDNQLYKKYGISPTEVNYIKKLIKTIQ